jgi:protocatechuate 4,5-dioxygenase, beta chain
VVPPYPGHPELSWHLIESLVADEFDITTCQEMRVDHAFTLPLTLLWPGKGARPVRTVPVVINHVQYPLPTPKRCYKLGAAIGRAIQSFDDDLRVVVIGSGGLSHQLDGERAGFLNPPFDRLCMDRLVNDPEALARYSVADIVRLAGAQGTELSTWLAMRAALQGTVVERHQSYHVPISNTATAVMVLENAGAAVAAV